MKQIVFSYWGEYAQVFLLRPLLAILIVFSLIAFSWFVAWKTVLVHVPLVQEIFGLKRKSVTPKHHARHRLSRFYNAAAKASSRFVFCWICSCLISSESTEDLVLSEILLMQIHWKKLSILQTIKCRRWDWENIICISKRKTNMFVLWKYGMVFFFNKYTFFRCDYARGYMQLYQY